MNQFDAPFDKRLGQTVAVVELSVHHQKKNVKETGRRPEEPDRCFSRSFPLDSFVDFHFFF